VTNLDKSDVLAGLFAVWDEIDMVLAGLAGEQWQAQSPLPGWTVHDVTAHVIGTESMLQGVATPEADVDVSTLKHVRNDVGVMNERWVRKLRGISPAELLDRLRDTTAKRREALSDMPDDEWNQITATPAGPDTYGRFMRVRDFDCWMHLHDIRDALDQPAAELAGSSSRLALDEMAASMGFVVGKLGGAPEGSRVVIASTSRSRAGVKWLKTSVAGSRRRRSLSMACCSRAWPAAGRPSSSILTLFPTAATKPSGGGSSSISTT
jgi:uncharacterized protein (TIGR03083 family)